MINPTLHGYVLAVLHTLDKHNICKGYLLSPSSIYYVQVLALFSPGQSCIDLHRSKNNVWSRTGWTVLCRNYLLKCVLIGSLLQDRCTQEWANSRTSRMWFLFSPMRKTHLSQPQVLHVPPHIHLHVPHLIIIVRVAKLSSYRKSCVIYSLVLIAFSFLCSHSKWFSR